MQILHILTAITFPETGNSHEYLSMPMALDSIVNLIGNPASLESYFIHKQRKWFLSLFFFLEQGIFNVCIGLKDLLDGCTVKRAQFRGCKFRESVQVHVSFS